MALLVALGTALALTGAPSASAAPGSGPSVERIFGADRYETSVAVAEATVAESHPTSIAAVLVNGDSYADAASASNEQALHSARVVLLTQVNALPPSVHSALTDLPVDDLSIVGGPAVVGPAVYTELGRPPPPDPGVYCCLGRNRFETALWTYRGGYNPEASWPGEVDGKRTAFLVNGYAPHDLLAATALSYGNLIPLLMTGPDTLPAATRQAFRDNQASLGHPFTQVVVVGGRQAVSPHVIDQLRGFGLSVRRVYGTNRFATATALARFAERYLGWHATTVDLTRGDDYADALSAAAHAGQAKAPLIYTFDPDRLGAPTTTYLRAHAGTVTNLQVIGGPDAVSDQVVAAAVAAAS